MAAHESSFDREWIQETGASTGDARENQPTDAGYTAEDRVFRSHFQRVNRLVDISYEQMRPAYELGRSAAAQQQFSGSTFDEIEKDLENGWLSVRVGDGDWASVKEFVQVGFDAARQGRVEGLPPAGTTPSHDRPSFADPLAGKMDPTDPSAPEYTV